MFTDHICSDNQFKLVKYLVSFFKENFKKRNFKSLTLFDRNFLDFRL